ANQSADSTARNLTLAPTESTAAMKDVPATTTERAKPAPEKKAPQPAPKPATPVVPKTLTAAAGTRVPLAASESISTRQAKPGVARHRRGAAEGRHHHHQADEATDGEAGLMIGGGAACRAPTGNSKPYRAAAAPGIGHADPAGGGSLDGGDVAHPASLVQLVAHGVQALERGRGQAPALVGDRIRQRLLVHARRRHGLRERHAVVHDVHDHLVYAVDDRGPARRPDDQEHAATPIQHDRRRHRR